MKSKIVVSVYVDAAGVGEARPDVRSDGAVYLTGRSPCLFKPKEKSAEVIVTVGNEPCRYGQKWRSHKTAKDRTDYRFLFDREACQPYLEGEQIARVKRAVAVMIFRTATSSRTRGEAVYSIMEAGKYFGKVISFKVAEYS